MQDPLRLASVVFRLNREKLDSLKTLSRSTRIRQSEYLREAIADVLSKHEWKLTALKTQSPKNGGTAGSSGGAFRSFSENGSTELG